MALVEGRVPSGSGSPSFDDGAPGKILVNQIRSYPRRSRRLLDYLATRNRVPYHHGGVANLARNHPPFLYRMNLMKKLPVHDGCVNTISWNKTGEYILSGSDDCNLCITKPSYMFDHSKDYTVLHKVPTRHLGNIFSAQFIPNSNDYLLVSCSSEGPVIVHDINSNTPSQGVFNFNCHSSTIFEVVTLQDDDKVFLSCGEDKTVRLFDMRCHRSCARAGTCPHPALISNSYAMTAISVHPLRSNLLLVGRADGLGLVYDRRKLPDPSKFSREQAHLDYLASADSGKKRSNFKYLHPLEGVVSQFNVPDMEEKYRFTSLCYSADGEQVLASYSQDYVYLFNHDKSSNFELIQTLPRGKQNTTDDGNSNVSERASNQTGRAQIRGARTPRIRMRGDWSDTGVNSVPHSARSENNSSQVTPNFMQRMSEVAFSLTTRRLNASGRFVPMTEIIAGPIEYVAPNNDPNNTAIDQEEENDSDNDGDEEDKDETDDEELETVDLRIECENVVEKQEETVEHEDCKDDNDDGDNRTKKFGKRTTNGLGRSHISPQTRAKFKKTVSELKNRFNKIPTYHPRVRYQGHRNSRTSFKEAIFWGDDYIMSGSDCGRIMIWEKETAKLVMGFPADERVVNCLAPNPHHYALASSGIDYDIKLWSTQGPDSPLKVSEEEMNLIVKNNELMLEEAKSTITVPPHLFFRVLASFAQNRLS